MDEYKPPTASETMMFAVTLFSFVLLMLIYGIENNRNRYKKAVVKLAASQKELAELKKKKDVAVTPSSATNAGTANPSPATP